MWAPLWDNVLSLKEEGSTEHKRPSTFKNDLTTQRSTSMRSRCIHACTQMWLRHPRQCATRCNSCKYAPISRPRPNITILDYESPQRTQLRTTSLAAFQALAPPRHATEALFGNCRLKSTLRLRCQPNANEVNYFCFVEAKPQATDTIHVLEVESKATLAKYAIVHFFAWEQLFSKASKRASTSLAVHRRKSTALVRHRGCHQSDSFARHLCWFFCLRTQ